MEYDIFDTQVGLDSWMRRDGEQLGSVTLGDASSVTGIGGSGGGDSNPIENSIDTTQIAGGELASLVGYGKKTFVDSLAGFLMGLDSDGVYKFTIGDISAGYYLYWDGVTLTVNGSTVSNQPFFGDGNDGNFTISVDTTLSADVYASNFTVNAGKIVHLNGFRLFVKNTLTLGSGATVNNDGGAGGAGTAGQNGIYAGGGYPGSFTTPGTGGTAGAAAATNFFLGGQAGVAGSSGGRGGNEFLAGDNGVAGSNASAQTNALGGSGQNGGSGGNGGNGVTMAGGFGAGGGTGGTATAALIKPRTLTELTLMRDFLSVTPTKFNSAAGAASGGGGGGGGGTIATGADNVGGAGGGSGGSGAAGGIGLVAARIVVNEGRVSCDGGAGGAGGRGGAGINGNGATYSGGGGGGAGGAGGSGGVLVFVYSSLSGSGTVSANGGVGGTGGAGGVTNGARDGTAGATGATGTVGYLIMLPI